MDTREKIIDLARAAGIAARLRGQGERVMLVAGYFDVLTADHVRRFRELADGRPLVGALRGRPRLAVAAFLAGGSAALDAIERCGYDVRSGAPRASRARRALALARVLLKEHDGRA